MKSLDSEFAGAFTRAISIRIDTSEKSVVLDISGRDSDLMWINFRQNSRVHSLSVFPIIQ